VRSIPEDYYQRLQRAEGTHWWYLGMREITASLLRPALETGQQSLLDAGCGTGGFLAWAAETGAFQRLAGLDVSSEAIALARQQVPQAELRVASLAAIPFESESFDVVVANDVLQHVDEAELRRALDEVRQVLVPSGLLLVRTNAGRATRRERSDWRLYDPSALRRDLEGAGLRVERVTYVNAIPSLWASLLGRGPAAPTDERAGIPGGAGVIVSAIGRALLSAEARYLRDSGRRLPYGHTLVALARRPDGA
jgi:SAM-dependent methyltransferase